MLRQPATTPARTTVNSAFSPVAARFSASTPRDVRARSQPERLDRGDADSFTTDAMQTLSLRIAKLKLATDGADRISRACGSVDVDQMLSTRPVLPENVTQWEEVKADHQLIVDWHEQQWATLGENVDEW